MKKCPFCAEMIEDDAIKCKYCDEFLDNRRPTVRGGEHGVYWGREYKSKKQWFGLPLIHVAQGIDPETGRPRVAKGIIAIGNVAKGVIAIGGLAMGGLTFGGLSLGVFAIGGLSLGLIALGGCALAVFLAMGGFAASLYYAIGGFAIAKHVIGGNRVDQDFLRLIERIWNVIGPRDPGVTPPPPQ